MRQSVPDSRLFRVILFDWDGTAVPDRRASAVRLLASMQTLLSPGGIWCVVITGTHLGHLRNQGLETLSTAAKQRLLVCTNRGSEVWGYDETGAVRMLHSRHADDAENRKLDDAVLRLQDYVRRLGLETSVIFDRLNRRKLDLIPTEKWKDPKKAQFKELLHDVQERLGVAGPRGTIQHLMSKAAEFAEAAGLPTAKITSDIKHIEVGLTDKSDSVRWVHEHLIQREGIAQEEVAVLGDEFGSIGGVPGSDSLMRIPELSGALYASVGVEPEGVPPGVEHWGGGPERFVLFLDSERRLRDAHADQSRARSWVLEQSGFDPTREREMESLFCQGNGYLGVRGASDLPLPSSQPDLFIAGVYDCKAKHSPYSEAEFLAHEGRDHEFTELVPFPSAYRFRASFDGETLGPAEDRTLEFGRTLDLKRAIYMERRLLRTNRSAELDVRSLRCVSLADRHLLLQEIEFICTKGEGELDVNLSPCDEATLSAEEWELSYPHLRRIRSQSGECQGTAVYRTSASGIECAFSSMALVDGKEVRDNRLRVGLRAGQSVRIRRYISVFTSRDGANPAGLARSHIDDVVKSLFLSHLLQHMDEWTAFWDVADIRFSGRPDLTQAQRFNSYQLRIAADSDPRVSIGARGLSGRAYEGHVFWDSEIFIFPFFLHSQPEIARSLLSYRYVTLEGAKRRAEELGFQGACYAWESTVTGEDVTPRVIVVKGAAKEIPIFTGSQQIHVTAGVAHAVWRYWDVTGDDGFMLDQGVEILLETARFWRSRLTSGPDGKFHILNVVGPDEYHHDVKDNAYTCFMARFNLRKACEAAAWMKESHPERFSLLCEKGGFSDAEVSDWNEAAGLLRVPSPDATGLVEQFEGFFELKNVGSLDGSGYQAPIRRLLEWDAVNASQIVKQADALMIPFLFPGEWTQAQIRRNFEVYERVTDHGSSLSPSVHAAAAARAGFREKALEYWTRSLNFDLMNTMSNTQLGIHVAAIGGAWQALVFHLLGIGFRDGVPVFADSAGDFLPEGCDGIELTLFYRGRHHPLRVEKTRREAA